MHVLRHIVQPFRPQQRHEVFILQQLAESRHHEEQLLFRFTKIWEKIIVIIGEEWTERILINQERVEPRFA